ncbi:Olfactory receptor 18, partial [Sciurus carolinensis]|nr:Olfactory receptor 18 [Sciurus carolinensis]
LQNLTRVSEFHLLELSAHPDLQPILFGLFLSMYLVTVLGNLLILLAVSSDSHLHTPMYFFLSNLSLIDICFSSTIVPKMIADILTQSRVISYVGCLTQMSLFIIFACMDDFLLTVMACDRFVAICHPLHYPVIKSPRLSGFLVLGSPLGVQEQYLRDQVTHRAPPPGRPPVFRSSRFESKQLPTHLLLWQPPVALMQSLLDQETLHTFPPSLGNPPVFRSCHSESKQLATQLLLRQLPRAPVVAPSPSTVLSCLLYDDPSSLCLTLQCSSNIQVQNLPPVSEYQLMSLTDDPDLKSVLFGLFLSMYMITLLGNLLIILAVSSDSHLHTPMYFFLSILSFVDICFISTMAPKMIVDIQTQSGVISYVRCLTQMSLYAIFICLDDMILTVMAYDRFVAICHPLYYQVIMNSRLCGFLTLVSFLLSLLDSQLHNLMILQITNFKDVEIPSFFCDPSQLLNLSCSDTASDNIVRYFLAAVYGFFPFSGIIFCYYKIISSILRIPFAGGKYKEAFSTCGSHLAVVCLFFGTGVGVYLSSAVSHSPRKGAVASVMYTLVTPMLNPFIYSLRNRDIKNALRRLHSRIL